LHFCTFSFTLVLYYRHLCSLNTFLHVLAYILMYNKCTYIITRVHVSFKMIISYYAQIHHVKRSNINKQLFSFSMKSACEQLLFLKTRILRSIVRTKNGEKGACTRLKFRCTTHCCKQGKCVRTKYAYYRRICNI
jgi:hypothetical protein